MDESKVFGEDFVLSLEEDTPVIDIPILEIQQVTKRKRPGVCYLCDYITEINWRPKGTSYTFACCYTCARTYLGYIDDSA